VERLASPPSRIKAENAPCHGRGSVASLRAWKTSGAESPGERGASPPCSNCPGILPSRQGFRLATVLKQREATKAARQQIVPRGEPFSDTAWSA
jgi:hypothetical protein